MKNLFSKSTKRTFLPFIAVFLSMWGGTSCSPKTVELMEEETIQCYDFTGFHGIEADGIYEIRLVSAARDSVCVRADSALLPYLEVEEKNGILHFGFKEAVRLGQQNARVVAEVFYAGVGMNALRASGASKIRIENELHASNLEVRLTGASNLEGRIKVHENLKIFMSGASSYRGDCMVNGQAKLKIAGASVYEGNFTVAGKANIELAASNIIWSGFVEKADMQLSGASHVHGFEMMVEELFLIASGASDMDITVNRKLKARVSGSSDIRYQGTPSVESTVNGAGSVVPVR